MVSTLQKRMPNNREGKQVAPSHREGGSGIQASLPAISTPRALGMCTLAELRTPDTSPVEILYCLLGCILGWIGA